MKAYVWRNGIVEFGEMVPCGALEIAEGTGDKFKKSIEVKCRLTYMDTIEKTHLYLLPGVPEAANEYQAKKAVGILKKWINKKPFSASDKKFIDGKVLRMEKFIKRVKAEKSNH